MASAPRSVAQAARALPVLRLTNHASQRCIKGQRHFAERDVERHTVPADTATALVELRTNLNRPLGTGLYSRAAFDAVHLCHRSLDAAPVAPDAAPAAPDTAPADLPAYLRTALALAVRRRAAWDMGAADAGVRLVHGDGDGLPGLVVDRYASCLVCQASSPVMDAHLRSVIVPTLVDLTGATSVVSRHAEVRQRATERLPQVDEVLHGPLDPGAVEIVEDGVRHLVHPLRGQKTGCYLDQRGTRGRVRALAGGRTVLDLYGYQGGMALAALAGGALSAVVIDSSQDALALAQSAATLNGTAERLTVRHSDVTEALAALRAEGTQFGLIVVDPPRLVSGAGQVARALRFLDKVHRAACRLLAPDGLLVTCSCSPHLREDDLLGVVAQASAAVGLQLRLRERGGLPVDHPVVVSANTPRMDYLTVLILQRI